MTSVQLERVLFWIVPAGVLAAAFAGICVMTGTVWPWPRVVHEDGARTLWGTLFYFEHGTRELLPDLVLALAIAGAARWFFPPTRGFGSGATWWRRRLGMLTALVVAVIVGGTVWTEGGTAVLENLSQSHTRAGAPLVWGAHWRYHLIERVAQGLLAFGIAGTVWMARGRSDARSVSGRGRLLALAVGLFAGATVVFRVTSEPFREPTFLGHQLRELFTHTLVTLPLALGTCLELARRFSPSGGPPSDQRVWPIALAAGGSVASGAFLLIASVMANAQSHGQATGLAALLLPHFAEHGFGYVFVPAVAGLLYLWPRPPSGRAISPPSAT